VALWSAYAFDEGTGTTAADASGNGRNATIGSTNWTASGHTGAAALSSSNRAIASLPITSFTAWTMMFWVKFTNLSAAFQSMAEFNSSTDFLEINSSGIVDLFIANGPISVTAPSALSAGTWVHVAARGNSTSTDLVINGSQVATAGGQTSTGWTSAEFCGSTSQPGSMACDDLRVYDQRLDDATITNLMGTPVGGADSGPAAGPVKWPPGSRGRGPGRFTPWAGTGSDLTATIQGSATLSGAGTLTAAATTAAGATLAGAGTASATATTVTGAAVAGVGTLVPVPATVRTGGTLAGAGTLTAAATTGAGASLAGAGTLTGTATTRTGATLTGAGTVTAAATHATGSAVTGAGTVSALATTVAGATITGAGTLTATGTNSGSASATLTGAGTMTATATVIVGATLTGAGTVTALATTRTGAALAAAGTVTAAATTSAGASLAGAGTVTASATGTATGLQPGPAPHAEPGTRRSAAAGPGRTVGVTIRPGTKSTPTIEGGP
jgi:hypothetical protein